MLDKNRKRQHHLEVTYVLGRFMTEHFIRVHKAFDGDLTAAIVLGTIGQYNYRRYYAEAGQKSAEGRPELFFPMLASQHYCYLLRELDLSLSGERGNSNPAMPPILKNYSTEDKQAIAAYLAQLPPPGKVIAPESPGK